MYVFKENINNDTSKRRLFQNIRDVYLIASIFIALMSDFM